MEENSSGEGGYREEELKQLQVIFNLCDTDNDGIITVDDFRQIVREHFDKTQVS